MLTKMQILNPLIDEMAEILNDSKTITDKKRDAMYAIISITTKLTDLSLVDALGMLDVIGKLIYEKERNINAVLTQKTDEENINTALGYIS